MVILYVMMACQLIVWGWFSAKGGKLNDKSFLIFSVGMLLGQLAASVETFQLKAWGACIMQVYFFVLTVYGCYRRWSQIKTDQL